MKLTTELLSFGNNTGFEIPEAFVEELGGGKKRREAAGVDGGDLLEIDIELDTAPRVIDVPPALAEAFVGSSKAKAFWDSMSYSNQRSHAEQIEGAKTEETRARRVAKSVALLNEGKAR